MYAAGTGGLASPGSVIRESAGTSPRCQRSRSHADAVAMTRPTGDSRFTCGMASGAQGGDARLTIGDRARQRWPVTVARAAATRSGGSLATPLLRNQEFILHPLQLLHLRIAIVVNACHRDLPISLPAREPRGRFRRVSVPEPATSFAPPQAAPRRRPEGLGEPLIRV